MRGISLENPFKHLLAKRVLGVGAFYIFIILIQNPSVTAVN
jgi:hypothetical protein